MINEVKFSKFVETGAYVTEIDLGNLIRCECFLLSIIANTIHVLPLVKCMLTTGRFLGCLRSKLGVPLKFSGAKRKGKAATGLWTETCYSLSSSQRVCARKCNNYYCDIPPNNAGEHFTEAELVEYLMTLLGYSDNPEVDGSYSADVMTSLEDIPEKITAPQFSEEILGFSTGTAPS